MSRFISLVGAAVFAMVLANSALATDVRVRVEGVNTTLFGKSEPTLRAFEGPLRAADGSVMTLDRPTALGALEAASRKGEFFYRVKAFSFGLFVDRIGRFPASDTSGWVFKVNGVSPSVGAADVFLEDGDRVLWYHATFGPQGAPKTLGLDGRPNGCIRALAVDENGNAIRARNVVFKANHRSVKSRSGQLCPSGRITTLRVTKHGMIRSELVRPN